jgi:putative colanic acid biosynthesis UDP-glucose lipid carrier transferase
MRVMTAAVLRGPDTLADDLTLAATTARLLRADDVFILTPWSDTETVERCLDAFLCVPAAVHLGPGPVFDRLARARIVKTGPIASLALDRSSLSGPSLVLKRALDIVVASIALILLSPLFLALAIAIALDSKGPVLFRQRRYGFNQEPFRIFKFRSMKTLEDDRHVKQASASDPRITRIGRFMRRTNLDELPQLVNVLLGDMSLVGPRPHALAHDQSFRPSIALYARRHNVKPGITGWAQVNGLRGEVTPETLKARIEHDLYYIDNWSFRLDLWILWRTLASRKSFLNAG